MNLPKLTLAPGREKSLLRGHMWVFSGAVAAIEGEVPSGATVAICDSKGGFLASGSYSPKSQISARVWSFDPQDEIGAEFFARRIDAAWRLRGELGLNEPGGGCRLINSEGDFLPGLTVDRYGDCLVAQFSSAGAEFFREEIADALIRLPGIKGVYERSDISVRAKEGLPERSGVLRGGEPANPIVIGEGECRFAVDVRHGQKSGFYFDLRDAREAVARLARGRVLNAFCYTGGFAVRALRGNGEFVLNIDPSEHALHLAAHNLEMNRVAAARYQNCCADVFEKLRELVQAGEKFDTVILDPPKLVDSRHNLSRGVRAYNDLFRLGFELAAPGATVFNFSCSGAVSPELFGQMTDSAASAAGVSARCIGRLFQSADHPVNLSVPEGLYLKGLISKVV